jgi:hypothetical protein
VSTVLEDADVTTPDGDGATRRRGRRRWVIGAVLAVLVVGAIGTGVGFLIYAHTYQPLEPGNYGEWEGLHTVALGDGLEQTRVAVVGPAGTVGRMESSLDNAGSHDVRITGLGPYAQVDQIAWGPAVDKNRVGGGTPAEARPFPYTMKPHTIISIWIYVTQPRCRKDTTPQTITDIPLRWQALGVTHVYDLQLTGDVTPPITTCAGAKALKYRYGP